jgi:hypothetical protein
LPRVLRPRDQAAKFWRARCASFFGCLFRGGRISARFFSSAFVGGSLSAAVCQRAAFAAAFSFRLELSAFSRSFNPAR